MLRLFVNALTALLASAALSLPAQAKDADGQRIGLVLSGGAARGLAHIGVIKALEEQGIAVDVVTGTSMGAIIGAMYASGYSVEQMAELGTHLNWGYALTDTPPRTSLTFRRKQDDRRHLLRTKLTVVDGAIRLPAGVIDGQNLDLVLQDIFHHTNDIQHFDQLPLPFRAVATDLETGEQVILTEGSLARAVRASMSIPGMLTPVHYQGHLLADGGMANNMPVDVARALGVDRIIAVDIGSPLSTADELSNVFAISNQVTTFLTIKNVQAQIAALQPKDLLIQPDLNGLTSLDFTRAEEAIELGYRATLAMAEQLAGFSRPNAAPRPPMELARTPTITAISLNNNSYLENQALLSFIRQRTGEPFDRAQLEEDINTLYGLDYFNSVSYQLHQEPRGKRLHLMVEGDKRRKGFLRFGFNASDNFTGDNYYNIALAYNQTGISTYGAEWFSHIQLGNDIALASEFYLPLRYKSPFYVLPKVAYTARDIPLYNDDLDQQLLLLRDKRVSAGLFAGYQVNHEIDFSLGLGAAHGLISLEEGRSDFQSRNYQHGYGQLSFQLDSEDNVYFPTQGSRIDFNLRHFDESLDANATYNELEAYISHAQTFGKNTWIARAQTVRTDGDNAIPSSNFLLGGLGRLSGLPDNSVVTQNHELAALFYVRLLNSPLLVFDTRYYFIASLEMGRAWNNDASDLPFDTGQLSAGSLGLAMDSPIGPIVLSYGFNSADQQSMYFSVGKAL